MKAFIIALYLYIPFTSVAQTTTIPDSFFEQALIDLGYDDEIDQSVLTSSILPGNSCIFVSQFSVSSDTAITSC